MVENAEQMDGYKLESVTRVNRDFLDGLPSAVAAICEPITKANREGKKLRVVMDYDPQSRKAEFRYYCPL